MIKALLLKVTLNLTSFMSNWFSFEWAWLNCLACHTLKAKNVFAKVHLFLVARSLVYSILWSSFVMIGFVMTTNLSQLKIPQLQSRNKWTLPISIFTRTNVAYLRKYYTYIPYELCKCVCILYWLSIGKYTGYDIFWEPCS